MGPRTVVLRLSVATLLVAAAAPLRAADGARDASFTLDGLVSWRDGGDIAIAGVAAGDTAAYGIGTIELPGEEPALHWKAFGNTGTPLGKGCAQASDTLFTVPPVVAAFASGGNAALVDPSGNLLVGGWASFPGTTTTRRALLARFDLSASGCALDTTFNAALGWAYFDAETWCDTESCEVVDLAVIRPETGAVLAPRIVALVRAEETLFSSRFFLLALTAAGEIDTGFSSDGWREVTASGLGQLAPEAHLAVDGRGGLHVLVARFDPAGTLDLDLYSLSFNAVGALAAFDTTCLADPVRPWFDGGDDDAQDVTAEDIAIAPNGDWVVSYHVAGGNPTLAAVDVSACTAGTAGYPDVAYDAAIQGDGKVVSAFDLALADDEAASERRLLSGSLPADASYGGGDGREAYEIALGGSDTETVSGLALWAGRPLLAGTAATDAGPAGFLLRAQNSYLYADSFEQGTPAYWSATAGFDSLVE